ncbi:MAG: hypothetical protein KJZ78_11580, partial [Bryobacteraceae bacterium]|nr:hypothetical protein [Bryobacteraceae bacterium]
FFSADDGVHGRELWSVDAMKQCAMVYDGETGENGSNPESLMDVGEGRLFFCARTEQYGIEPYRYVQSEGSVRLIGDLRPGPESSEPVPLGKHPKNCYFHASINPNSRTVFAVPHGSDGLVQLWRPLSPVFLFGALLSDESLIIANGKTLLRANGSAGGTSNFSLESVDPLAPYVHLVSLGSRALLRAHMPETGAELWSTDGTQVNTRLVYDIWPGSPSAEIGPFTVINGEAWFQANDGIHGIELWKTDGTPDGTFMVKDLCPGFAGSDPHYFVEAGGNVYFCANDGEHGVELWVSDGTAEGTRMVIDLHPGSASGEPWSLCEFKGLCFFCANSPEHGEEVFCTDGTSAGTRLLKDIVPGRASSGPDNLTNLDNHLLYFTCNDGIHGEELWSSDGSPAGTALVRDIWPHTLMPARSSRPHELVSLDNTVVFAARDTDHGEEIWCSDGSSSNTRMLHDINLGSADSRPSSLTRLGPRALFTAESVHLGRELWCSDGTARNTALVKDIRSGPASSNPRSFLVREGEVLFLADGDGGQAELWRSEGTPDSTMRFVDMHAVPPDWRIEAPFALLGKAYFYAADTSGSIGLFEIARLNGEPLLVESMSTDPTDPGTPPQSLRIDGGSFGSLVRFICPPRETRSPPNRTTINNREYFAAYTMDFGSELWSTDGTIAGTGVFIDSFPGSASSSPTILTFRDGQFLFSAEHPRYGRVLWQSDGTKAGTYVIAPLNSSGHSGSPVVALEALLHRDRIVVAGYLADDNDTSRDLIVLHRTARTNVQHHSVESIPLNRIHNF